MYQNVKRTCTAIVFLLIKPTVLWRCRCRRRTSLLELANVTQASAGTLRIQDGDGNKNAAKQKA